MLATPASELVLAAEAAAASAQLHSRRSGKAQKQARQGVGDTQRRRV